jgi:hypothetical protein
VSGRAWWLSVAKLTGILTCVGLATTRIGLVAHELVGHGGTAIAVGGRVTDVQLFWFAGGWVRYQLGAPGQGALAIALGGIVLEAVVGSVMWWTYARRDGLGARLSCGIGAALIVHAFWYLATGTWHGYGDGVELHRALGDAKWLVAVPAAAIVCAAAYAGARGVLGALAATLPARRIAGTLVAVGIAGGLQLGAAVGEVRLRRDATYTQTMRPERERLIALELARWAELQRRHGRAPSAEERAQAEQALADAHHTFPFAWLLAALTLASVVAGAIRARPSVPAPVTRRLLVVASTIACASIMAVIAIDLAFH